MRIIAFARENGCEDVLPPGKWKDCHACEPVLSGATKLEPAFTGSPLMIFVRGEEIRMSTPEKVYEQIGGEDI